MNPSSLALLGFIPLPNLPGDQLNYHASAVVAFFVRRISLRFTQNLSPTVPQNGRGGGGGGRGGFGGGGGFGGRGFGGRAGQGRRGTNIVLQGQLQYRRNENASLNVFPGLGGQTINTSVAVPLSLNIVRNRFDEQLLRQHHALDRRYHERVRGRRRTSAAIAGINYPAGASTRSAVTGACRVCRSRDSRA